MLLSPQGRLPLESSSSKWQSTVNLPGWFTLLALWRAISTKHSPWGRTLEQSSSVDPNTRPSQFSMYFIAPNQFWIPSPDLIYLESSVKPQSSESSCGYVICKASRPTVTGQHTQRHRLWAQQERADIVSLTLTAVGLLQEELFLHS